MSEILCRTVFETCLADQTEAPWEEEVRMLLAHDAALRASNAAMREALRHAARELQYIREAGRCDQGSLHVSSEGLACIALAESLLGPMRDWPEEPNASARAADREREKDAALDARPGGERGGE